MSDTVIHVENLGKKYRIELAQERQRYTALRDVLARKIAAPFRALFRPNEVTRPALPATHRVSQEDFWALRNISFDVGQGEVIGIIGRNGAGKSTLLKILSRISEPTEGRVRIRGRIASLLEVGTGFHPELTGRENIYLNGAILGMTRVEIGNKFDEIVAFAEVEKFLDTPVKRYSSGMYVRLAFGVAAHLEPEILIVDEVLAVGDAEFQKKCLGRMSQVARNGRTVLFVSHNLSAAMGLCSRGILMQRGHLIKDGSIKEVCDTYSGSSRSNDKCAANSRYLSSIAFANSAREDVGNQNQLRQIRFHCTVLLPEVGCLISLLIKDASYNVVFELFDEDFSPPFLLASQSVDFVVEAAVQLRPGIYWVDFWLGNRFAQRLELAVGVLQFEIDTHQESKRGLYKAGPLEVKSTWTMKS